jgi:hypothetical protein
MILRIAKMLFIAFLLIQSVSIVAAESKTSKKSCKQNPNLSGPCFKVRGRMSLFNGNPSIRIWPIGTKRRLGISEGRFYLENYSYVPEDLERKLNWHNAIFADFTVCPFTDDKPGVMRLICVESAENISIRELK